MKRRLLLVLGACCVTTAALAAPVVTEKVLLTQGANCYQSVRHIVIKGTNEEIGEALGEIAKNEYGVSGLLQYPDALYAEAAKIYLKTNYPILWERSRGVAAVYAQTGSDSKAICNQLVYDAGPWNGCSSVYYPPALTKTNSGFLGHNMDYPLCSIDKLLKLPGEEGSAMFARNYVIELYPDKGYASIGVGTGDLLSVVSGMNEEGLIAVLHTDNYTIINTDPEPDISGLIFPTQIVRCVLDTCKNIDEAKVAILNNKISFTFEPAHLLIADATGRSVTVEINHNNARVEFTENPGSPQVFTNHPNYRFIDAKTFPPYTPFEQDNTFARYNALTDLLNKKTQYSEEDVLFNQEQVVARWNNPGRGMANPAIPNRTIWTDVYDQKDRTLKVKFYLKDGEADPATGDPNNLVFSDLFTFRLQRK